MTLTSKSERGQRLNLLGIAGSIRRESFSSAILAAICDALGDKVAFGVFPLHDVPLYNEDLDLGAPPSAVVALRHEIKGADGVVIVSPEYNHGTSGVLKNALDWASRPINQAAFAGKPVLIITSSPGTAGGVRAHSQLHETLMTVAARIVLRPQLAIPTVHQKVRDGRLVDQQSLEQVLAGIDDLIRESGCETRRAGKIATEVAGIL